MPGFNATDLVNKVRNANNVVILAGDQVIGFAQNMQLGTQFGTEQMYGIGSAKPQENQQLKVAPTFTLESLQLTAAGIAAYGYSTPWVKILANTELDFSAVDGSNNVIITAAAATATDYSSTIPVNQPITESTSFVCLDLLDSNGESVLDGNGASLTNALASAGLATVASA